MSIPNSEEDPVVQFQQDGPSDEEIRLRALKQTKDRLMSIVGHYLRTAVGGVRSLTSMLERRLEKETSKTPSALAASFGAPHSMLTTS